MRTRGGNISVNLSLFVYLYYTNLTNKSKFDVIFKIKNENNNIDVKIHYYLQYHKETFVNLVMRRERFVGLSSY